MVDYIADYLENIRTRRVFPGVSPGYMSELVSESAPDTGEPWEQIFADVERVIMPGVSYISPLILCTKADRGHFYFSTPYFYNSITQLRTRPQNGTFQSSS